MTQDSVLTPGGPCQLRLCARPPSGPPTPMETKETAGGLRLQEPKLVAPSHKEKLGNRLTNQTRTRTK
jgi:hypothetical protein